MDGNNTFRLHHIDLSRRRSDLESIFESVINKIPDLCLRPGIRFADEEDYFNKTSSVKLQPFRKQRIFDKYIAPEFAEKSESIAFDQTVPCCGKLKGDEEKDKVYTSDPTVRQVKVCFEEDERLTRKPRHIRPKSPAASYRRDTLSRSQLENRRKLSIRNRLYEKYSHLKLRKKLSDDNRCATGYDRILRNNLPSTKYPYANPIPDCMLTDDNIDNLREIIVSSESIEWRMLTSIRPTSQYEEEFFDNLIRLHRQRYRARLASGYFTNRYVLSFRHTRHSASTQYMNSFYEYNHLSGNSRTSQPIGHNRQSPLSLDAKLKHRFHSRREQLNSRRLDSIKMLSVPMLMLTPDETTTGELIENSIDSHDPSDSQCQQDTRGPNDPTNFQDNFTYESFSRFARLNLKKYNQSADPEKEVDQGDDLEVAGKIVTESATEELDDIMNQLVSIQLD